jgi:hypothetical protein
MTHMERYQVTEVHNFGGFFGGDTITLDAAPLNDPEAVRTLVIDARALANVPDRHTISAGMVFELDIDGERVDLARLLAAPEQTDLRHALGRPTVEGPLEQPLLLSGRCPTCGRWVLGDLWAQPQCRLCAEG